MIGATIDAVATYAVSQPDAPALTELESGRRWTYAGLDRAVDAAAAWLVGRLGPASGERVATLARNSAPMLILHLAAIRAGAVFVPLNWRLSPAELGALVADAGPELLFHDEAFAATAAAIGGEAELHGFERLDGLDGRPPADARRSWDQPATLLYTSGTSGHPKGVILTESNAFFGCINFVLGNDVGRDSVFLCDMPLFHTAGLFAAARVPLLGGGHVLVSAGFDEEKNSRPARRFEARNHSLFLGAANGAAPLAAAGFRSRRLRTLKYWATGGAPNPAAQVERFVRAGVPMSNGFGMSETGSNYGTPMDDVERAIAKAGSCGLPYAFVRTTIADEDGNALPPGETGELWLAGPSVTPGYWNRPEENLKAFSGGWFKTGDAAFVDTDGFLSVVDRRKDMYISGGENVYPAEVEAALAEMAGIAEAAVIGVPDDKWGEVGRAYLIAREGHEVDEAQVRAHCGARLAKFKVPASVVIGADIPRTASGKILKHVLRDRARQEMGEANA